MTEKTILAAMQGADTEDFLQHIAWQEVVLPELRKTITILTKQLVDSTLVPSKEGQPSKEQIAGKLFGIDWTIKVIEDIVSKGKVASKELASHNYSVQ